MIELTNDTPPDAPPPPDRGDLPGDSTKRPKYLARATEICWEEEEDLVGEQAGDPTKRPK